jgi:hypothetical protein
MINLKKQKAICLIKGLTQKQLTLIVNGKAIVKHGKVIRL